MFDILFRLWGNIGLFSISYCLYFSSCLSCSDHIIDPESIWGISETIHPNNVIFIIIIIFIFVIELIWKQNNKKPVMQLKTVQHCPWC